MCHAIGRGRRNKFFVADDCHPQTISVVQTRARPLGIEVVVGDPADAEPLAAELFAALLQYPATDGRIENHAALIERLHEAGARVVMATDLLALTLLRPPGELGADVGDRLEPALRRAAGLRRPARRLSRHPRRVQAPAARAASSASRATPRASRAYRLALQTREQHIRREKATSNICTAQVLLAVMAGFYAVYHGPEGLRRIARRVHGLTRALAAGLRRLGYAVGDEPFFDTLKIGLERGADTEILTAARSHALNLRHYEDGSVGVALDETTTEADLADLLEVFAGGHGHPVAVDELLAETAADSLPAARWRDRRPTSSSGSSTRYRSEHEMLRYLHRLQARDLSLTHSMIPLGSCTMKLNATTEMMPVTLAGVRAICIPSRRPSRPRATRELFEQLERLAGARSPASTRSRCSPTPASQGEYAGLLVIRAYHESRGDGDRDVCLIPTSAHGTNPASAVMAGMRVVAVACDEQGNVDLDDLRGQGRARTPTGWRR